MATTTKAARSAPAKSDKAPSAATAKAATIDKPANDAKPSDTKPSDQPGSDANVHCIEQERNGAWRLAGRVRDREAAIKHATEIAKHNGTKVRILGPDGDVLWESVIALKPTEATKVPDTTFATVPLSLLQAALVCSEKAGGNRYHLAGIFLHRREQVLRVAATDGHRLLIGSHRSAENEKLPPWLDDGIILSNEFLKGMFSAIGKFAELVRIGYDGESARATIGDTGGTITCKVQVIDGQFPDYDRVIASAHRALEGMERAPLDASGYDGKLLKSMSEIGAIFEATSINLLAGPSEGSEPSVVTFGGVDGLAVYLMPKRIDMPPVTAATAAILAPALRGSLAALRAHLTRTTEAAKKASEREKKVLEARAESYKARIAAILAGTGKALPAPEKPADDTAKAVPAAPNAAPTKSAAPSATKPQRPAQGRKAAAPKATIKATTIRKAAAAKGSNGAAAHH